jgi:hypothetical protein
LQVLVVTFIIRDHYYPIQTQNTLMAQIAIELDWARDPKGYRLVETGRPKELRIVRNGKGHGPENLPPFQPLSTNLLFRIFANIATTPEGALDFVRRYGPLTPDGWDERAGDVVSLVTFHAEYVRGVLGVWAGKQKYVARSLAALVSGRHMRVVPEQVGPHRLVVSPYDTGPSSSINAKVIWDPFAKALKWELRPASLLDALWLQLGQALTANVQFRQCEHCGIFFEAGRGTGRRLDAKFCSDEHRIAFNSLKRSREK